MDAAVLDKGGGCRRIVGHELEQIVGKSGADAGGGSSGDGICDGGNVSRLQTLTLGAATGAKPAGQTAQTSQPAGQTVTLDQIKGLWSKNVMKFKCEQ
jgi:hypothetical protein